MRIYNTLTRTKQPFDPLTPGEVRIYSCGVTVYDHCHVGHARSVMVFDVICRYLVFRDYQVTFVRNYTDVDDKIIQRAQREGVSASDISERFIREFRIDMETLGVLPPPPGIAYHDPKATDFIPAMVALVQRLVDSGFAYVVDGDAYFEIARFPPYGRLSGKNLDDLLAGARVEVDERKRDPRDFALWKAAKPGEPAWPSPWGPGRPGWHIECSAMAMHYLGTSLDIHGGGADLIFPHHECEIAQSEAATGQIFSRYWTHNGLVNLGSEKMSKSLGNTLLIREVIKRHDPDALRLWMLGTQYRNPVDFAETHLRSADRVVQGLRDLITHARTLTGGEAVMAFPRAPGERVEKFTGRVLDLTPAEYPTKPLIGTWFQRFLDAMDDDFNTPEALAVLFSIRAELRLLREDSGQAKAFVFLGRVLLTLANVLGLLQSEVAAPALMPLDLRNRVETLLGQREEARKRRDWERSDALRAELQRLGVVVEDTPSGTRWNWTGP